MSTTTKGYDMASATSTHTQQRGAWSAGNVQRPTGSGRKWDDKMKRDLVEAVMEADKAGLPRTRVFQQLARRWSKATYGVKAGNTYTEHQVASQFHLIKSQFDYDVAAQVQRAPADLSRRFRKLTAPPTKSQMRSLPQANAKIDELRVQLERARDQVKVLRRQRDDALADARDAKAVIRDLKAAL